MFSFFKKKSAASFLETDIHSHLLPGIDDGVKSAEDSIHIIRELEGIGIKRIVTTPHIMADYYPNTPEIIRGKLDLMRSKIKEEGLEVELHAAAEYYLDESFLDGLEERELLTFGDNFILVETAFLNRPLIMEEAFFRLSARGLKPILAHPERYVYLQDDYSIIDELVNANVLLQINVNALVGYYSRGAQKLAEHLINQKLVSFLGSDIHNNRHLAAYKKAITTKYFQQCRQLPIHNNSLSL